MKERTSVMMNEKLIYIFIFFALFNLGCSKTVYETIKSNPSQADIYWGKTSADLEKTEYKTPFKRSIPESKLEPWCFQVKKDGYRKSKIFCREKELSWLINVELVPLKTTITSEPPGATIYWGPTKAKIHKTGYETPHTESDVNLGANWKDWWFQVKKDEYNDSAIEIKANEESDRHIHFNLMPVKKDVGDNKLNQFTSQTNQVTLSWEYNIPADILGFELERRKEPDEQFKKIADIGPNETSYKDAGLIPGATYYYRMRAFDANFKSEYTDEIKVKIFDKGSAAKK